MSERNPHDRDLDRLDPEAAAEIIRRAAELDAPLDVTPPGLDRAALVAAADEVGLSPAAVRRAMAEHDAGTLAPAVTSGGLLGPARSQATRLLELPVAGAVSQVERWLKGQLFERYRRDGDEVEWRPRDDLGAKVRRKVDGATARRVRLSGVDAVLVTVVAAGEGRSLVRLVADLEHTRRGLATGVVAIPTAVGPILGGAAALVTGEIALLVGGVPLGMALGSLGIVGGRRTLANERLEASRTLDRFLDDLEDS